jgi:hypothetical protein
LWMRFMNFEVKFVTRSMKKTPLSGCNSFLVPWLMMMAEANLSGISLAILEVPWITSKLLRSVFHTQQDVLFGIWRLRTPQLALIWFI